MKDARRFAANLSGLGDRGLLVARGDRHVDDFIECTKW